MSRQDVKVKLISIIHDALGALRSMGEVDQIEVKAITSLLSKRKIPEIKQVETKPTRIEDYEVDYTGLTIEKVN